VLYLRTRPGRKPGSVRSTFYGLSCTSHAPIRLHPGCLTWFAETRLSPANLVYPSLFVREWCAEGDRIQPGVFNLFSWTKRQRSRGSSLA